MRSVHRGLTLFVIAVVAASVALAAPPAKDAATDALRQAAEKAVKDGRHDEALSLLNKIVDEGSPGYQDYLLLARTHEKLKQDREAAAAYRKVAELTSDSSEKREERAAYREAKQKLATVDVLGGKIEAFAKDAEKKISDLTRDAEKARDWDAAGRLMAVLAAVHQARGVNSAYWVLAADKPWQGPGYKIVQGKNYRVRVMGRWRISPKIECGPEGTDAVPANSSLGPTGCVIGLASKSALDYKTFKVGADATFLAPLSGSLLLVCNEGQPGEVGPKQDNSGSMYVFVEQLD